MTPNYKLGLGVLVFTYLIFYAPMVYALFNLRKYKKDDVQDQ